MDFRIKTMKQVVKTLLTLVMVLTMGGQAYAGDLSMLIVVGAENASEEFTATINDSISKIPDHILDYHKKFGATVSFSRSNLQGYDNTIAGIYYYDGDSRYDVMIRTDEAFYANYRFDLATTLPHEIGHFVWDIAFRDSASEEDRRILKEQYDFWKNYRFDCKNQEETFAALYVTHLNYPENLSEEVNDMFDRCEERIEALNKAEKMSPY